jgi:hypothetical protein|tara:strand:+ start:121 stop:825 length:705 start_codon:yes stop_codon:yes gene_type:complete
MPFLGVQPSKGLVGTAGIDDDSVTEAKIANDAIGLTELKAGTDGELITWDASGNPTVVGAGTSGHFLKSQGAGSVPVFAAPSSGGKIIQIVKSQISAVATTTTLVPMDDTIPQNNEGFEAITLAVTPTNSSSILMIDAIITFEGNESTGDNTIMSLFQDSTANALASTYDSGARYFVSNSTLRHSMVAGTTSSTTFKIRLGPQQSGTLTVNGRSSSRVFGGVSASSLVITEYTA